MWHLSLGHFLRREIDHQSPASCTGLWFPGSLLSIPLMFYWTERNACQFVFHPETLKYVGDSPRSFIMMFTAGCEEQQDGILIASASKAGRDDVPTTKVCKFVLDCSKRCFLSKSGLEIWRQIGWHKNSFYLLLFLNLSRWSRLLKNRGVYIGSIHFTLEQCWMKVVSGSLTLRFDSSFHGKQMGWLLRQREEVEEGCCVTHWTWRFDRLLGKNADINTHKYTHIEPDERGKKEGMYTKGFLEILL